MSSEDSSHKVVNCVIRLLYGSGLKVADIVSSDPYVVFSCKNAKAKSKVIKETLDPVWDEVLTIKWDVSEELQVDVWDEDRFSRDDFLGQVLIRYADAKLSGGRERCATLKEREDGRR